MDSLFLDEGFGTLDEESLETALETLSRLQQDGKLIGIISHVPVVKERISTQITTTPVSGGRSSLAEPDCSMTDRHLLVRDNEQPLDLMVVDDYQTGEIRSTKNLSGGESFIVSLTLALGLSKMASRKVRVDSLFLDEGFGTLDEESLETALEPLSRLLQDGKLIGIISHVPASEGKDQHTDNHNACLRWPQFTYRVGLQQGCQQ